MSSKLILTLSQLLTALAAAKPGSTVHVSAGTYTIPSTLVVPPGVTLEGIGTMGFDARGRPTGFSGLTTILVAAATLDGDILVLSPGSTVRGVVVRDVKRALPAPGARPYAGNLVVHASSGPSDRPEPVLEARIEACELVNPNASDIGRDGPTCRGVLVFTRNDGLEASPAPHTGASVALAMHRSIVRASAGGTGVFAVNFAPRATVTVTLTRNVIGGGLDAVGGVSRPDFVDLSRTAILSESNLYRAHVASPNSIGWALRGGSNPPPPSFKPVGTDNNSLYMSSTADVIEGFAQGIHAAGGWRPHAGGGALNGNEAVLELDGTTFVKSAVADVRFFGAQSGYDPPAPGALFAPGDRNVLKVRLKGVRGSAGGPLGNVYEDSGRPGGGALPPGVAGTGNRLEIAGPIPFEPGPQTTVAVKPLPFPE